MKFTVEKHEQAVIKLFKAKGSKEGRTFK